MKKVKRDDDDDENKNVQWTSRLDFIVSLLGVSLGLADIWRVPYLTYRNGGGMYPQLAKSEFPIRNLFQ